MNNYQPPQTRSSLTSWLSYIGSIHHQAIDLSLERIRTVAERLDLLKPSAKILTVAGTNGKGTTCCVLEAILLSAGLRVGVYSSPHLLRYTERIRIQGLELPETAHCNSFADIEAVRGTVSLTYFEFSTLSALHLFRQAALDVLVLEVGLGGRLDATNIIDADVAAITSIGLDHIDRLGADRESIGCEKAGIFRRGKPAIVGEPDMPHSVATIAAEIEAKLYHCNDDWQFSRQTDDWCWQSGSRVLTHLPLPKVPLQNAATALAILHYLALPLNDSAIYQGLQTAFLPGRFQILTEQPLLILDVAHNPHAARYLIEQFDQLPKRSGKIRAVVGMLADKDIASTLTCLSERVDEWYCVSLTEPRGASAELLAQHVSKPRLFADVESGWYQAMKDADSQDVVIVCGSFHTVAQVMTAYYSSSSAAK